MSKLIDPGKDKATRALRKAARLAVFKRPSATTNKTKETAARKADWEAVTNGTDFSNKSK